MISTSRKLSPVEVVYVMQAEQMLADQVWGPRIEFLMCSHEAVIFRRLSYGGTVAMKTAHEIIAAQRCARKWLEKFGIIEASAEEARKD